MPLQVDAFEWRGASLGEIHAVTIRTDGSGLGADWQLDRVKGARRCFFEVLHAVTLRQ